MTQREQSIFGFSVSSKPESGIQDDSSWVQLCERSPCGDPQLLCEVCELGTDGSRIAAIQRRRAVFAESVAERFCVELGAEPAILDHRDFEDLPIEPGQIVTAGRSMQIAWYLVETTDAVYRFHASGEELSAEVRQQLRGVLESFRTEDTCP